MGITANEVVPVFNHSFSFGLESAGYDRLTAPGVAYSLVLGSAS